MMKLKPAIYLMKKSKKVSKSNGDQEQWQMEWKEMQVQKQRGNHRKRQQQIGPWSTGDQKFHVFPTISIATYGLSQ